jgi:GDPmannose 4,6-dehydratase
MINTTDSTANGKRAFITGITGQDGAYLAALLLRKGYEVHGMRRRLSSDNSWRLTQVMQDLSVNERARFTLHYGDMADTASLARIINQCMPDEIYNLAAQSHVAVSFETPEYTAQIGAVGVTRLLECIGAAGLTNRVRFYQASSSELFGKTGYEAQHEQTPFHPRSPYAAAKLYAYWLTVNYREAYGLFACNGILFNHESPLRDISFVTRKITSTLARIYYGSNEVLTLGNLYAHRDWGYAPDYVMAMWQMMQHTEPDDFVIATGQTHTVKEFIECACAHLDIPLIWQGAGVHECAINTRTGQKIVAIDKYYFRPTEVDYLLGCADKAATVLGWKSTVTFKDLVHLMMSADLALARNNQIPHILDYHCLTERPFKNKEII